MTTAFLAGGPPATRIDNVKETLHGVEIVDQYRWLEDQKSPETRAWIAEQNKYTRSALDGVGGREILRKRFGELLRVDSFSRPFARAGRYFLSKKSAAKEQPVLIMREGLDGADRILVDPVSLGRGNNISVSYVDVSDDGKLVAYAVQDGGKDEFQVRFLDLDSGKHLKDESGFYYSTSGDDNPRVREHTMGTLNASDRDIFGKGYGAEQLLGCEVSEDGRYLAITVWFGSAGEVTELWVKDLRTGDAARNLFPGVKASFQGSVVDGRAIVKTNWNAAKWRILSVDLTKPAPDNWRELVPEGKVAINDFALVNRRVVLEYLQDVKSVVKVHREDGAFEREIALPSLGSISGIGGRWKDKDMFYTFTSFHIPPQIYRYDLDKGSGDLWFKVNTPLDAGSFELKQVWFPSKDGTRVPMFLLSKKGKKRSPDTPVLLGGYGGFNVSLTPAFAANGVVFAEMGGIYAIVNLRGGSEFGEDWHTAGMRDRKQNVFDDFIAAAEYLIREKYTKPSRLAISGGSNGGLLVGAALTQRPDLYRAVICSYPLLDMIRYHKFLVAKFWVPEYGSSDDPKMFDYIRKYSPYHNVKKGTDYPAVMVVTGDGDTRVDPLHGRKFAALLQANSALKRPVYLLYDVEAGHAGGMSTTKNIDEQVDRMSFLVSQLGIPVR
jgi:prolyl oligopeptidase